MKPAWPNLFASCLFLTLSISSTAAMATVELVANDVSIKSKSGSDSVDSLIQSVKMESQSTDQPVTLCAAIKEINTTFLCVSSSRAVMNQMFTRVGFYWGTANGYPAGTLISNSDPVLAAYNKVITGQNLPGEIISDFYAQVLRLPRSDKSLNSSESEFLNNVLKSDQIKKLKNRYAVIGIAADLASYEKNLVHETQHAKYYTWNAYRNNVNEFWKIHVTETDKRDIRNALSIAYNSEDEKVVIDEFQAYMLEDDSEAEDNLLASFVSKYRQELTDLVRNIKN